jgi:very-short-patch-repair endonuclease
MGDLDRVLAKRAALQRSLVTVDDVLAAGGTHDNICERLAAGRWDRVDHGVYLIAGAPDGWETRQLAAVLAAGPGAVTSHLAAARLYGIPGYRNAGVELSIPRGRRYRRGGVRSHESTDLERCTIVNHDGIPVTDPNRMMLDLGRYIGVTRLTRAVEAARRKRLVTWASLIATLARHARKGRHGTRRLRAVILQNAHREDITDTDMELLVLGLIRDAGLPEPVVHHLVRDGDRVVAEVDLAYPHLKIAIECDGSIHLEEDVRDDDLRKQNELILLGWTVLRFGWSETRRRPDRVPTTVREAIRLRS